MNETEGIITEIAMAIKKKELVVFCGAGISFNSGLPVIAQFVPYMLLRLNDVSDERINEINQMTQGKKSSAQRELELITQISAATGMSEVVIRKIFHKMPFELFVEKLNDGGNAELLYTVYDADEPKPNAVTPNANHIFLARLLKEQKITVVVTTNFDQLIEKALALESIKDGIGYALYFREDDLERIEWNGKGIQLVKVHGSVHDKKNLAITLKQVASQKLAVQRNHVINQMFSTGGHKIVLILGYSCSDAFDLVPQIQAVKVKAKRVIYVEHTTDAPWVQKLSAERLQGVNHRGEEHFDKVHNTLKDFEGVRLGYNTNELITRLWNDVNCEGSYLDGINEKKIAQREILWKNKITRWVSRISPAEKMCILGAICISISELRSAMIYYERALRIARDIGDRTGEGSCLGNLGIIYSGLSEYRKAIEYYVRGLRIIQKIGHCPEEGAILSNLGNAYCELNEFHKAREYYELGLKISRKIGDKVNEGRELSNLGKICHCLNESIKAIEYFEQALQIMREIGNKPSEGAILGNLGNVYHSMGKYHDAIEYYEQALKIAKDIGDRANEAIWLGSLGIVYNSLAENDKAIECYKQALKMARDIGDMATEGTWLGNLGVVCEDLCKYTEAIEYYEQALRVVRNIDDRTGEKMWLTNLGNTYYALGKNREAIECWDRAENIKNVVE